MREKWRDLEPMPRQNYPKDLLDLLSRFPQGASLEEVMIGLPPTVSRRTVQRWLSGLVQKGELQAIGQGRARKYALASPPPPSSPIPLSAEGTQIQAVITLPIQARKPVSYHREFLERYIPNQTFYLPESSRQKLLSLGGGHAKNYPAGTYARQIFNRLLIDLSWNSSRLEGNTYSLLETKQLLEEGKSPQGRDAKETQMILNHKAAIEFLIQSASSMGIHRYTLLNLHTLLSDNLMPDPAASGRLRSIPVGIAHSVYQPSAIPQVIEECFNLLIDKAKLIKDPLEQSFFLMVQLPYLQPFDDVNKRTSRLAANISLVQNNLTPLSFIDVPESIYIHGLLGIYELNRIELFRDLFEWAYERSCILYATTRQTLGEPDPFRIQYRLRLKEIVTQVVLQLMNREEAILAIRNMASQAIPAADQPRFIELAERELLSLHEGNIARYQLLPSDYERWQARWTPKN